MFVRAIVRRVLTLIGTRIFCHPILEIGSVGVSHQYVYDASIEMLHDGSIVPTLQDQSHVSDAPLGLLW